MIRALAAILTLVLVAATVRAQTVIELRTGARVGIGGPITLGDVATISRADGTEPDATLPGTVLIDDPALELRDSSGRITLEIARVRELLDERVDWSDTVLRGGACRIVEIDADRLVAARARLNNADRPSGEGAGTLRDAIAWRIARSLRADAADLRLEWDPRDAHDLATPTAGRTVDARVTGSSDRFPVRYTVYEGDRVVVTGTATVGVSIRRRVAVAREPIARRTLVEPGSLIIERRWVSPALAPADPASVAGSESQRLIERGAIVRSVDVQPPVVVDRGDRVAVECIANGVIVRTEAWALESGRDGEIIRLKSIDDPKGQRPFNARLNGPGRAVAVADGTPVETSP